MNTIKRDKSDGTYDIRTEAGDSIGYMEKEYIQACGCPTPNRTVWWVWDTVEDIGVIYNSFAEAKRAALALGAE